MSLIQSGKIFTDGEQLTAAKLNQIIGDSTISTTGVDGSTIIVNENNTLAVRSGGISSSSLANSSVITNKLANSTDATDGVTLNKIQFLEQNKILGRTSTGTGQVEAVNFFDQDDLGGTGSDARAVASQQSIKAYVDNSSTDGFNPSTYSGGGTVVLPNGLIMKFGVVTGVTTQISKDINFLTPFPNGIISVQTTATNPTGNNAGTGDYWYQIKDQSQKDKVTIFQQQASSATSTSHNVNYLVIGY